MNVKSCPCRPVRALAVAGCVVLLTVAVAIPSAAKPYVDPCLVGCVEPEVSGLKAMVEHVFAVKMAKELRAASGVNTLLDLNYKDLPVYA